nr:MULTISPECIES: hypothetical protein [unclassified Bradyrhizobium]
MLHLNLEVIERRGELGLRRELRLKFMEQVEYLLPASPGKRDRMTSIASRSLATLASFRLPVSKKGTSPTSASTRSWTMIIFSTRSISTGLSR